MTWYVSGTTLEVDWTDVFEFNNKDMAVKYEIYVGAKEGSAEYGVGIETIESTFSITSPKLVPPSTVYFVITAVMPAGVSTTYRETLYL